MAQIGRGDSAISLRPDVVWSKNGNYRIIFEIDTGSRDKYQKSIYGSMLSGVILSKEKKAKFVQIVPRSPRGTKGSAEKAKRIAKIIRKELKELIGPRRILVVDVPRRKGKYSKEHIQKSLTKELRNAGLIKK